MFGENWSSGCLKHSDFIHIYGLEVGADDPYEKEKEAAYRLPIGSLWVAYCFTYNLQTAPVGKSCLFVALLAAYGQPTSRIGNQ